MIVKNYWYTMPIAQPVMEFINEKNLQEIVNGVLQLCETLEQLHDKGYITGISNQVIFITMKEDFH